MSQDSNHKLVLFGAGKIGRSNKSKIFIRVVAGSGKEIELSVKKESPVNLDLHVGSGQKCDEPLYKSSPLLIVRGIFKILAHGFPEFSTEPENKLACSTIIFSRGGHRPEDEANVFRIFNLFRDCLESLEVEIG